MKSHGELATSSHIVVLEYLFGLQKFDNVLEFGCGNYSTGFFVQNAKHVTSVEMNSVKWYEKIKRKFDGDKLEIHYMPDNSGVEWFKNNGKNYDLIFVDGEYRKECINASFGRTPLIAVHDIGFRAVKRGLFKDLIANTYEFAIINESHPSVSLFILDQSLAKKIRENKYCVDKKYYERYL